MAGDKVVSRAKNDFGFNEKNNRVYCDIRARAAAYIRQHRIQSKTQAGQATWDALCASVMSEEYMSRFRSAYYADPPGLTTLGLRQSLNTLLINVTKNVSTSMRKARVQIEDPLSPTDDTEDLPLSDVIHQPGRSVRILICDPDLVTGPGGEPYMLRGPHIRKEYMAMLSGPTMEELVRACRKKLPAERFPREILGATESMLPDGNVTNVRLTDNEEVMAWLSETTEIRPLYVLAVLHRTPDGPLDGINTPVPLGDPAYLSRITYDAHSDDEAPEQELGTRKRRNPFPTSDMGFERRLRDLRNQQKDIEREKTRIKVAHRAKFPDATHSDDEDWSAAGAVRRANKVVPRELRSARGLRVARKQPVGSSKGPPVAPKSRRQAVSIMVSSSESDADESDDGLDDGDGDGSDDGTGNEAVA